MSCGGSDHSKRPSDSPSATLAEKQETLRDNRNAARVEMDHVATLRFQDVTVFAPDLYTQVARLPDSGWGAISYLFGGSIALFSATGTPTGTLGSPGPGPGEFEEARFALSVGKQLWVIDDGNKRLTAFGSDGVLLGDRRLPGSVFFAQPTTDGTGVLLSGYFNRRTVARVTMDERDDRFGGSVGTSTNPWATQDLAAETPFGEIWAVAWAGGEVDIMRADNLETLATTHLPEDLSYPVRRPATGDFAKERPGPLVVQVMVDSYGILWVAAYVADAHWQPRPSWRNGRVRPPAMEEIFDTLLLAISTRDREIVGALRLDQICVAAVDGLISCTNEDAQTIEISRVGLERRVGRLRSVGRSFRIRTAWRARLHDQTTSRSQIRRRARVAVRLSVCLLPPQRF